jgi:hypothetical protein
MLPLGPVLTSQNDVRNVSQVARMIAYVRAGGLFTKEAMLEFSVTNEVRPNPQLVAVTEFPDGMLMIHDGNHRSSAIWLGGRGYLADGEYFIKKMTYAHYLEINLQAGWYTPFDPRTEIRLCDFGTYKKKVRELSAFPEKATAFIVENRAMYCAPRDIWLVAQLAEKIQARLQMDASVEHGSGFCLANRW